MTGKIVVDLCFGDSGKGITTDYLCSQSDSSKIVVRFSGGQQAGHNVIVGDTSHVHSNYGSGTLRGVPSYFSEHCTMYPLTMWREGEILRDKGINPIITFHPLTMVTTPFDVAYNRIREMKLGHGSVGLGVGATMSRNMKSGYKLYAIDLFNQKLLNQKLAEIRKYYSDLIYNESNSNLESWNKYTLFNEIADREFELFMESITKQTFNVQPYQYLHRYRDLIFEGSQGVLLDMDHGIFPNVTYANTTSKNAIEICEKLKIKEVEVYYVTRCYQTRHGSGWMSNETKIDLINTEHEINVYNDWQKDFRIGELDYDLLNYALNVDQIYSDGVAKNLVVTCLDQRPGFVFKHENLHFRFKKIFHSFSPESKNMKKQN